MNPRSLVIRATLVAAFLGFALVVTALAPPPNPDARSVSQDPRPLIFLPLVHAPFSAP